MKRKILVREGKVDKESKNLETLFEESGYVEQQLIAFQKKFPRAKLSLVIRYPEGSATYSNDSQVEKSVDALLRNKKQGGTNHAEWR
jgi:hypothetical protein